MKTNSIFALIFLFIICFLSGLQAQSSPETMAADADEVYRQFELDYSLEFPGGTDEMVAYLHREVVYPIEARENAVEGIVRVEFIVMPSGRVGNAKVLEGLGFGCDEEVLRAIMAMPHWTPGVKNNSKVATRVVMAIGFSLLL